MIHKLIDLPKELRERIRLQIEQEDRALSAARLPAVKPQRLEGRPLVSRVPRETESGPGFEIVFTCYAVRPCDWDGWHVKPLQDMVVKSGIVFDDKWDVLGGRVYSRKVHTPAEERTEIEIHEVSQ